MRVTYSDSNVQVVEATPVDHATAPWPRRGDGDPVIVVDDRPRRKRPDAPRPVNRAERRRAEALRRKEGRA